MSDAPPGECVDDHIAVVSNRERRRDRRLGAGTGLCIGDDATFLGNVDIKAKDGDDTVDFSTATVTGTFKASTGGGADTVLPPT